MTTYIYHLLDEFGNVRYVGRCVDPVKRLCAHCNGDKWSMGPVWEWCQFQLAIARVPEMRLVMAVGGKGVREEREEIRRRETIGDYLLNIACVRGCKFRKPQGAIFKASKQAIRLAITGEWAESVTMPPPQKRAKRKPPTVSISVRVSPETYAALKLAASEVNVPVPVGSFVTHLVREWMKRHRSAANRMVPLPISASMN